jgi:hypothetical protein
MARRPSAYSLPGAKRGLVGRLIKAVIVEELAVGACTGLERRSRCGCPAFGGAAAPLFCIKWLIHAESDDKK